ncbi:MAG: hypothetical protein AAGI92_08800 [Pseudomonadota bacterium]
MSDTKSAQTRLNIAVGGDINAALETIAAENGTSKTAVVRQALALIQLAHEEKKKGRHLGFTDEAAKLDTEIVGAF